MKTSNATANDFSKSQYLPLEANLEERVKIPKRSISRRSFLGKSLAVGASIGAGRLLFDPSPAFAAGGLTTGDAAILRFAAAAEILETDFWV